VVEQAIAWQDPVRGNFPHPIGECKHEPRCVGSKAFMVGIVLEGMRAYHELTGDEQVRKLIIDAADWLVRDAWVPRDRGFYYADCKSFADIGRAWDIRELNGLVYAYMLTHDRKYLDIGLESLVAGTPLGPKAPAFNACICRNSPHFVALATRARRDH